MTEPVFVARAPAGALAGVVRSLWVLRTRPVRRFERILPQAVAHLIVNLSDPYRLLTRGGEAVGAPFASAFVSGLQREYLVIENPAELWQCGAEIEPGAIPALTSTDPALLADRVVEAEGVIPGSGGWRAILRDVESPEAALERFEGLLAAALCLDTRLDPLAARAIARLDVDPDAPIAQLAAELGVPHGRLTRSLRDATGITPKAYADLSRFVAFIAAIPADGAIERWADAVAATGYYDQAHFIRSFRRYTGVTPTRYLRGIREFGADYRWFLPEDAPPAISDNRAPAPPR